MGARGMPQAQSTPFKEERDGVLGLKAGRGLGQGVKLWGRETDSGT